MTGFFALISLAAIVIVDRVIEHFVIDDSATALSSVANNIRANYLAQLKTIDEIARADGFSPFDKTRADQTLEQFLRFNPVFSTIHVYRRDGALLLAKRRPSVPAYYLEPNFHDKPDPEYIKLAEAALRDHRAMASTRKKSGRRPL